MLKRALEMGDSLIKMIFVNPSPLIDEQCEQCSLSMNHWRASTAVRLAASWCWWFGEEFESWKSHKAHNSSTRFASIESTWKRQMAGWGFNNWLIKPLNLGKFGYTANAETTMPIELDRCISLADCACSPRGNQSFEWLLLAADH